MVALLLLLLILLAPDSHRCPSGRRSNELKDEAPEVEEGKEADCEAALKVYLRLGSWILLGIEDPLKPAPTPTPPPPRPLDVKDLGSVGSTNEGMGAGGAAVVAAALEVTVEGGAEEKEEAEGGWK